LYLGVGPTVTKKVYRCLCAIFITSPPHHGILFLVALVVFSCLVTKLTSMLVGI
jgi:hypothetical protein